MHTDRRSKRCIYVAQTPEGRIYKMEIKGVPPKDRISLEHCRGLLKERGKRFSDEQVLKIRDNLYEMALLNYKVFLEAEEDERQNQKPNTYENTEYKQAA